MKSHFSKPTYVILLAGLALLAVLVYRYFAPFGKEVKYNFNQTLPNTNKAFTISGSERNINYQSLLVNDAVTRFSISNFNPNKAESLSVDFKFKSGQKEIKLGINGDNKSLYTYFPIYNSNLLDLNWSVVTNNGISLWQKNKKYDSVADFVTNPPENSKTAIYYVDPNQIFQPESSSTKAETVISTPLRQEHTFLIKVLQSPLKIDVTKQDYNLYPGPDKFRLSLYLQGQLVAEKTIDDDGITDASGIQSKPQDGEISLDNVKPGIYTLKMGYLGDYSGDGQISQIKINQKYVIVSKYLFTVAKGPTTVYSDSSDITVSTSHSDSIQDITLDNKVKIPVKKQGVNYDLNLAKLDQTQKLYQLDSPKSDVSFSSDGYFAFSPDSFFLPYYTNTIDLNAYPEADDLVKNADYVLSAAPVVSDQNGWLEAHLDIPVDKLPQNSGNLYFSLEIPDISKHGDYLEIGNLSIVVKDKATVTSAPTPTTFVSVITPKKPSTSTVPKVSVFTLIKMIFSGITQNLNRSSQSKPTSTPTLAPTIIPTPTQVPSGNCYLNDKILSVGSTFAAADGCNSCTCNGNLQIECTSNICSQK